MKNELFIIAPATLAALGADEVAATVRGLKEMDLFRLPYPKVDIQVPIDLPTEFTIPRGSSTDLVEGVLQGTKRVVNIVSYNSSLVARFIGLTREGHFEGIVFEGGPPKYRPFQHFEGGQQGGDYWGPQLAEMLITLLATKNARKEVKENKLARLGIGPKKGLKSYPRVTTISLPKESEMTSDTEHPPTGRTVAPHLRRGHTRAQRYGPGFSYQKLIWIDPVFVNADPEFVSKRQAYNVSL